MNQKTYNFFVLFILNSILQIFDGTLTYIGISMFGPVVEGNYLIQQLVYKVGNEWGLILPKAGAIMLLYLLYKLIDRNPKIEKYLYIILGFYSAVVLTWILAFLTFFKSEALL